MLLLKALLLVCSATAVLARGKVDAIMSGACLVGQDTSKHNAQGEDVFKDPRNHPAAVASILAFSADRAEFRPREKGVITDEKVYDHFLKDVANFPGFRAQHQQTQQLNLQGSRVQFKKEVANKYQSDRNDPWEVARLLESLLPQEMDKENQRWLLNYVIVNSKQDNQQRPEQQEISVEIGSILLSKNSNSDKTKIEPQTAEMTMHAYVAKADNLKQHSSELSKRIRTMTVQKALRELATNGGDDGLVYEEEDTEDLEAWFRGLFTPLDLPTRHFPVSKWVVQY
ncbi:hypothetical protein BGZ65_002214 [Modicella reniformis]|uniref:Uncharacterized protein n=1 Tax=Modicella reniformis TaxID=1440133 RepID=A0A9P6M9M8_9FUNG|nr:hypothetical protein BGZ65_002214 [Modicella reniformis]